jgi:hypothetical protein
MWDDDHAAEDYAEPSGSGGRPLQGREQHPLFLRGSPHSSEIEQGYQQVGGENPPSKKESIGNGSQDRCLPDRREDSAQASGASLQDVPEARQETNVLYTGGLPLMRTTVLHKWSVYFDGNGYAKEIMTDVDGPDGFSFVAHVAFENKTVTDNKVTKVDYKGSVTVYLQDAAPALRREGKRQIDVGE